MIKETNQRIVKVHFKDDGFWDLVADKRQYDHFYDMCESFDNIDEDGIVNMLLDEDIEVVFLED